MAKGGAKIFKDAKAAKAAKAAKGAKAASPGKRGFATLEEAAAQFAEKLKQEKPNGTRYKTETYMVVARWTEHTKLKYGPNPKTPGSKSHPRYERYAKAKTVGEALRLGAYPADLLWDYERGFYKVVGGPTRDEPVDLQRAQVEGLKLSKTDLMLGRWCLKELCKDLGTDQKTLLAGSTWQESAMMRALRLLADRQAGVVLEDATREKRGVTNDELLSVLRKWCYFKNPWRLNVMKEGQTWVNSDTVGLNCGRDGDVHAARPTFSYPRVMQVLARWIRERQPPELQAQFHFTSINMNFGYAAVRHRDGNNVGLSMLTALGDCRGGDLRYWPDDDRSIKDVAKLPAKGAVNVDIKKSLLLFDGQRCHEVTPFQGERYSLVWFTCARYWEAGKETLRKLSSLGFEVPSASSVSLISKALRPPQGYGAGQKAAVAPGGYRTWPSATPRTVAAGRAGKRPRDSAEPAVDGAPKRARRGGA